MAVVDPDGVVYLYDTASFSLIHTYTPVNLVSPGVTGKVSFDNSSQFMVVESDTFNDIVVYDTNSHLSTFSVAWSTGVIHGV